METLAEIYGRAVARHGGEDAVEERLPAAKSTRQLRAIKDDRYLAEMSRSIFRSGFVWKVVEANNFIPLLSTLSEDEGLPAE